MLGTSLTKEEVNEIAEFSYGNLNKATNQIALMKNLNHKKSKETKLSMEEQWKLFHVVGKFLYNKRTDSQGKVRQMQFHELENLMSRPPLYFQPEHMIYQAPIEPFYFWPFLYHNFPEFYSSIQNSGDLLEFLSVSDVLDTFERKQVTGQDVIGSYIPAFIAGRAVLDCNLHPKHTKFYAFQKPFFNKLLRKQQEQEDEPPVGLVKQNYFLDIAGFKSLSK